jgi:hypothetical protein
LQLAPLRSLQICPRRQCRVQLRMHLSAPTPQPSKYMAGAIVAGAMAVAEVITMDGAIITIGETWW